VSQASGAAEVGAFKMSAARPTPNDATFMFRLPAALKHRIFEAAICNCRNPNAELLLRLEASFANESIDEHGVIVVTRPAVKSDNRPGGHS
jgi:hypothetical protein